MLRWLIPQENGFFTLFQNVAAKLLHAAEEFNALVADLDHASSYSTVILTDAQEGDKLTKDTFDLLHKTFITPFDRYHIHKLASNMNDVLDLLKTTSQKITLYQIHSVPKEIESLAGMALEVARLVKSAVHHLHCLKKGDEILKCCRQILKDRSEAEQLGMNGIANLFAQEENIKDFLKKKEIYESMKRIFDKSQNLANIMKGIVLEYA